MIFLYFLPPPFVAFCSSRKELYGVCFVPHFPLLLLLFPNIPPELLLLLLLLLPKSPPELLLLLPNTAPLPLPLLLLKRPGLGVLFPKSPPELLLLLPKKSSSRVVVVAAISPAKQ